ncbi:RNA polymerase sigma factor [Roseiconus sp. JC912]|uniref:RNA polymerase sigma factor n=1 Tax=Roseiconus sp. JC912 TaxID=3396307 RepID=UPI003A4C7C96
MSVSESTALRYRQSDPDVRLMLRVKNDDAAAYEELLRKYHPRLVRLLRAMGPRADMAEDLAQETFMRVWRARERYEPGAKFSTWLFTIAANVARNATRSQGRRQEVNEVDAPTGGDGSQAVGIVTATALEASGLMPSRVVEGVERGDIVLHAVKTLGERQRTALMLSRFENLSYAEIAETMGLTTKAVKSLLSRARVNLRELLQPYIEAGTVPKTGDENE